MKNSSLTLRVTILYCMSRYGNEVSSAIASQSGAVQLDTVPLFGRPRKRGQTKCHSGLPPFPPRKLAAIDSILVDRSPRVHFPRGHVPLGVESSTKSLCLAPSRHASMILRP